ncbi:MAG: triphosphoribosyl-dephospho-CoA synthase [Pirellulaceae bacterium]|nr:MAG: triphosphoribosyl-dephospho-CoA synthase [Pirellulaceae bacterium]
MMRHNEATPSVSPLPERRWSLSECITLACLLEVTVPKPGNVHRAADFEELTFLDFVVSAVITGQALSQAGTAGVGKAIRDAVYRTHAWVGRNTNLGIVLLLGPLAAVPDGEPLHAGIGKVLQGLTPRDAHYVYEAIRAAGSRSLGRAAQWDVYDQAPDNLLDAMRLVAGDDLIARQYVTDFAVIFQHGVPWLLEGLGHGWTLSQAIIHTHLRLLAAHPDSLILRKCGRPVAEEVSQRASRVLESGLPGDESYERELAELDFYLRCDGQRRNPGTTADLIAATLFVLLRENQLAGPWR